ncbi:hypothetical protein HDU76_005860 [Blyttiomyces sp. JEL0837]|nr:hypothetical protein HDU76_005860 [Blyttiomyces sp. JEL0837]
MLTASESPLPVAAHLQLDELEADLKAGDITPQGYEKRRAKILSKYHQVSTNDVVRGSMSKPMTRVSVVGESINIDDKRSQTASPVQSDSSGSSSQESGDKKSRRKEVRWSSQTRPHSSDEVMVHRSASSDALAGNAKRASQQSGAGSNRAAQQQKSNTNFNHVRFSSHNSYAPVYPISLQHPFPPTSNPLQMPPLPQMTGMNQFYHPAYQAQFAQQQQQFPHGMTPPQHLFYGPVRTPQPSSSTSANERILSKSVSCTDLGSRSSRSSSIDSASGKDANVANNRVSMSEYDIAGMAAAAAAAGRTSPLFYTSQTPTMPHPQIPFPVSPSSWNDFTAMRAALPSTQPEFPPPSPSPKMNHSGFFPSTMPTQASADPIPARTIPFPVTDDASGVNMSTFPSIVHILHFRSKVSPKATVFTSISGKGREIASVTFEKMLARVEKLATTLMDGGRCQKGDHVGVVYKRSEILDYLIGLLACFLAGMVAVPIVTSSITLDDEVTEILFVLESCRVSVAVTSDTTLKSLTKAFSATNVRLPRIDWVKTNDFSLPANRIYGALNSLFSSSSTTPGVLRPTDNLMRNEAEDSIAYVEFSKNAKGELKGVVMRQREILKNCANLKGSYGFSSSDVVLGHIEPRQQCGLIFAMLGLFTGHHTVFVAEGHDDISMGWVGIVDKYKITSAICDYPSLVDISTSLSSSGLNIQPLKSTSLTSIFVDCLSPDSGFVNNFKLILEKAGNSSVEIVPILSLPEFAGVIIAGRDRIALTTDSSISSVLPFPSFCAELKSVVDGNVSMSTDGVNDTASKLMLCDSGFPSAEIGIAIVDSERRMALPRNQIGEIWVCSSTLTPKSLWNLPLVTAELMQASAVFLRHTKSTVGRDDAMSHSKLVAEASAAVYLQTGLMGLIIDENVIPEVKTPRVLVVGLKSDRVLVENLSGSSNAGNMVTHFANILSNAVLDVAETIKACVVFNIPLGDRQLLVLLAETEQDGGADDSTASKIYDVLKDCFSVSLYAVVFCRKGSLPRYKPDTTSGTGLQSTFNGYVSGIAYSGTSYRKVPAVDIEKCKNLLLSGDLCVDHFKFFASAQLESLIGKLDNTGSAKVKGGDQDQDLLVVASQGGQKVGQIAGGILDIPVVDDHTGVNLTQFPTICHILMWRAQRMPEEVAYALVDQRSRETKIVTLGKLSSRVHSLAHHLRQGNALDPGSCVLVMMPFSLDMVYAIYGCLYAGVVPVPFPVLESNRLDEDVAYLIQTLGELRCNQVLCNPSVEDLLRSKPVQNIFKTLAPSGFTFPNLINIQRCPKLAMHMSAEDPAFHLANYKRPMNDGKLSLISSLLSRSPPAMFMVSQSADGLKTRVQIGHAAVMERCKIMAIQNGLMNSLRSAKPVIIDEVEGAGIGKPPLIVSGAVDDCFKMLYSLFAGVYAGLPTVIIAPQDFRNNPQRSKPESYTAFLKAFLINGLVPRTIAPVYSPVIHPMVSSRGYMPSDLTTLWIDLKWLRRGKVKVLKETSHQLRTSTEKPLKDSIQVHDYGKILNNTIVAVVDINRRRLCSPNELGEIWVCSPANVQSIERDVMKDPVPTIIDLSNTALANATPPSPRDTSPLIGASIEGVDPSLVFARTGQVGFLWPVSPEPTREEFDSLSRNRNSFHHPRSLNERMRGFKGWDRVLNGAPYEMVLFVLGSLDDVLFVNGLKHFPVDLEATVEGCHRLVASDGCVIFKAGSGEMVCVVETTSEKNYAALVPVIVGRMLEEHEILLDIVCFVKQGQILRDRYGKKQRGKMAQSYASSTLSTLKIVKVTPQ